ncbi:MAG: 16S rRNA (guanine(527)-N(7))-methyltransferase RsmG [Clostridia bacterium]|nr:16S rRNA (guanine(527)-N(7))-methyltransferase RsmG [Clostridia bacterium]
MIKKEEITSVEKVASDTQNLKAVNKAQIEVVGDEKIKSGISNATKIVEEKSMDTAMQMLIVEGNKQNLTISDTQQTLFEHFFSLVTEKNKVMNLTTILEREEFFVKHLVDSIIPQKYIKQNATVLDLGCGGGFPSIPLKIVRPDLKITAMDATNKKIEFVKDAISELQLKNTNAITARAEEMGQGKERESFDVVVSRAVASLTILMELALPLVKIGGVFIAYKTNESESENIEKALYTLGAVLDRSIVTQLPNGDHRCLLIFKKIAKTNASYPRNFGQMKKKPL